MQVHCLQTAAHRSAEPEPEFLLRKKNTGWEAVELVVGRGPILHPPAQATPVSGLSDQEIIRLEENQIQLALLLTTNTVTFRKQNDSFFQEGSPTP